MRYDGPSVIRINVAGITYCTTAKTSTCKLPNHLTLSGCEIQILFMLHAGTFPTLVPLYMSRNTDSNKLATNTQTTTCRPSHPPSHSTSITSIKPTAEKFNCAIFRPLKNYTPAFTIRGQLSPLVSPIVQAVSVDVVTIDTLPTYYGTLNPTIKQKKKKKKRDRICTPIYLRGISIQLSSSCRHRYLNGFPPCRQVPP